MSRDEAPLTPRSPGSQIGVEPANFSRTGGPDEQHMQDLPEPASAGKSLLFRVYDAITGSKGRPAVHNMPRDCRHVLKDMANRAGPDGIYRYGIGLLETDGDMGASTVRKCVNELLERHWISEAGWHGPPNRQVRQFAIHTEGGSWAPSTSKAREAPPLRRKRLALSSPVGQHEAIGLSPDDEPASHGTMSRPIVGREAGLSSGGGLPPSLPPLLPPSLPGERAPAAPGVEGPKPKPGLQPGHQPSLLEIADGLPAVAEPPQQKSRGRKKAATEIPEGWGPKPAHFALGDSLGFDRARVESEAAMFVDRVSAKGELYVDWEAAFRTSLRFAKKFQDERGAPRGVPAPPPRVELPDCAPRRPPPPGCNDKPPGVIWHREERLRREAAGELPPVTAGECDRALAELCDILAPARSA